MSGSVGGSVGGSDSSSGGGSGRAPAPGLDAPRRRPRAASRRPRPARCLAGLRVLVGGRNRAGRLGRVLEALRPAVERGAEVVHVDRGSRDGSGDLVRRRFPFARTAASLDGALTADPDAPPPRFVAVVGLGAEVDWRCLRGIMRGAARGASDALFAPDLVAPDGRALDLDALDRGALDRNASGPEGTPPVWCARAATARRLLDGAAPSAGAPVVAVADAEPALFVDAPPPAERARRSAAEGSPAPRTPRASDAGDRGMAAGGRRP